jgi:general transcription factor 3C polypeptide 1
VYHREKGLIQADLAKSLGVNHNNFFYVLKSLESRGLIIRHSLLTKDLRLCRVKQTNIVHLARYANKFANFGDQQRFVQSTYGPKQWQFPSATNEGSIIQAEEGTTMELRDDEPALKDITRVLQEAKDKVTVP